MKKWQRTIAAVLAVLILGATAIPAVVRAGGVPDDVYVVPGSKVMVIVMTIDVKLIKIDDVEGEIDVAPRIKWDRTFLPISPIIFAIGGTITWNAQKRMVTIVYGNKTIVLTIGSRWASVNGVRMAIDSNPDLVPYIQAPGRTMLPVRFIAEQLGAFVRWNTLLRRVTLVFPLL
jgi:hypothetical protein